MRETAYSQPVEPFDLVIFGGTGDLAVRKLLPALYHRFIDGQIPEQPHRRHRPRRAG
jgi:glucose-6-phosphate 1-dehydrogenase